MRRCWGGPLDGTDAPPPFQDYQAFPWPRGWYYLDGRGCFIWRDQPGTFVKQDEEWLGEQGFMFWQDER